MSKAAVQPAPPDKAQREQALDSARSILVQAPAGSGKTDLLTRRFLRLLGEVDAPGQIVAITFTNAAAAEMRHRIIAELEKASADTAPQADEFSMDLLAHRALLHSQALGWNLLDLPAQLRIQTIDSFCRDLALQQPLLSGFGGGLEIAEQPDELYRRAAREALRKIDQTGSTLGSAIEELLLWRDNGWQEMEELLVEMLKSRDRWMHNFVLEREPDWDALRERLERPFANGVHAALSKLSQLFDQVPHARDEALELARFACEEPGANSPWGLAESVEIPSVPFSDGIDSAREPFSLLSGFLQTQKGTWRSERGLKTSDGFPSTARGRAGKARFSSLVTKLAAIPGLENALAAVRALPATRYAEEDWQIVRSCFTLLRQAAAELKIVFAEAGKVDFIEVAQVAQRVLKGDDNLPTDAAMAVSDGIRHLLVDEFQDTSRRQHQLLSSLIAAWPDRAGRTCFVVGDPMQSIYFFRDADAELFPRVKTAGLEIPNDEPLLFDFVSLKANFRTAPSLVERLNQAFTQVFAAGDGSSVTFSSAEPARKQAASVGSAFTLHLAFVPQAQRDQIDEPVSEEEAARIEQIDEIVALIQGYSDRITQAKTSGGKFRIAVLGRARSHLVPIAEALRQAGIPFRAIELEKLAARPEVLDALALARALLNPQDRVAWLGVLRAPWCGLSLDDLHRIAGNDAPSLLLRPLPELIAERIALLSEAGRAAAARLLQTYAAASTLRAAQPTASLGTWLEKSWQLLGGAACVDSTARANLNLLWNSLDRLPDGGQNFFGPGLDEALNKLTALPSSEASSDCGVQLMTIHKSKGLEFEVVIVPELQAGSGHGKPRMLTWLERGLAEPDESGEITEFLIAPFQRKGADRGMAKEWVDGVYRERESQETRRILYVAATRAREELHLFARPAYKEENGDFILVEPVSSLLATAWPALEEEVRRRFEDWKAARAASDIEESQEIDSIAASGDSNLLVMPSAARPTLLRRLPQSYQPRPVTVLSPSAEESTVIGLGQGTANSSGQLYARHEGGLLSRALGTAVHTLLDEFARLRTNLDSEASRSALSQFEPRIAAQARAVGIDRPLAARIAAEALHLALQASHDPVGNWIFSPHAAAASEAAWTGVVAGGLRSVRVDRVFQGGLAPCTVGDECWWIIDYKTAHAENIQPAEALPVFRQLFAPQIVAYGKLLRKMHGNEIRVMTGLYYPRMLALDWWELEEAKP
ncbi:MAG: UvrD-helicase domain-containing protein [Terracidiphilus sp.]